MEKEMKKLLLVAVSVGFFLLVTITAAIIILTPKTKETSFSTSVPYSNGRVQITQGDEVSSVNTPPQPAIINSQGLNSNLDNIDQGDRKDGDNLIISLHSPSTAVSDNDLQAIEKQKTPEVSVTVKAPAPSTAVKSQTAAAPKAATTAKPAAAAKPAKTINDFWVQIGAFSAQVRAEDAREILSEKGITSIVENREINGKIWYRVRLGPYTSEREANHWLEIVKLIDGFNDSQIRQTVRQN